MIRSAKTLFLVLTAGCVSFAQAPAGTTAPPDTDRAGAYYHFAMGRLYAELASSGSNQSSNITKAIEHYQEALKLDPSAKIVFDELTDLYVQTGRLSDAIAQAEDLLAHDPDNLDARRMLGRIYTRAISDARGNNINQSMVKNAIEQYKKITDKDPKDAESWVMLGRLYSVTADSDEAEKALNAALQADPANDDAQTLLAGMYADRGDAARAIDLLKTASDKNPNDHTLAALADIYERTHDFKDAAAALQRAVALSPDDSRLEEELAQDLLFDSQFDEALPLYQEMAADDPQDAGNFFRIAQIYRAKHDLSKAREALNKAKALDPGNLDVASEEVNLLEAEGNTSEAITQLKALLDNAPRRSSPAAQNAIRAQLFERLGELYRATEQYPQAVDALRQAGTLDSESAPRTAVLIVDTYRQAKDLAAAQREADAALKKFPDERMVRVAHAELLGDLGKIDEAAAEIRSLPSGKLDSGGGKSKAAPGTLDRETQLELAQIYEKGKRWTEMGKALDAAEQLSTTGDERETVYFMRGAMYERMKRYDESEGEFRKVIQLNASNSSALNYLGYMLADRGVRLDEAQGLIQKALDLDPVNGAYLDSLGWVYYRENRLDQAEQLLLQAIDRLGQDPTVHDHLGDVYFKLGKTKEAIAQWQASVQEFEGAAPADNDPEELAKVAKKLESARVRLAKEATQK